MRKKNKFLNDYFNQIKAMISCPESKFLCPVEKQCIGREKLCDGKQDCKDGSDEKEACCK